MSVEAIDIDLTDPETAKAATTIQVLISTLLRSIHSKKDFS